MARLIRMGLPHLLVAMTAGLIAVFKIDHIPDAWWPIILVAPPAAFILRFALPMGYRLAAPIPEADQAEIAGFLRDRSQQMVETRKLWLGGPVEPNSLRQTGRPYHVLARDPDGFNYIHRVGLVGGRVRGDLVIYERAQGVWRTVFQ
jgi:hypothetical protein